MKTDTDRHKRAAEFRRLFKTAPGKRRIDRIRWTAKTLYLAEQTIRTYLMTKPPRVPTALSLKVLADAIANEGRAA